MSSKKLRKTFRKKIKPVKRNATRRKLHKKRIHKKRIYDRTAGVENKHWRLITSNKIRELKSKIKDLVEEINTYAENVNEEPPNKTNLANLFNMLLYKLEELINQEKIKAAGHEEIKQLNQYKSDIIEFKKNILNPPPTPSHRPPPVLPPPVLPPVPAFLKLTPHRLAPPPPSLASASSSPNPHRLAPKRSSL